MRIIKVFVFSVLLLLLSCTKAEFKQTSAYLKTTTPEKEVVLYSKPPKKKHRIVGIIKVWGYEREKLADKMIYKARDLGVDGVINLEDGKRIITHYSWYPEKYNQEGEHNIPLTVPQLSGAAIVFE